MSNIYSKITKLKAELSSMEIKKSGQNKHLGFKYHELNDFLGAISMLNEKYGLAENISVDKELATLTIVNTEMPDERAVVTVPTVFADMQPKNDSIQKLGATLTYLRRYLYVQAYAITEHDVVDALNLKEPAAVDNKQQARKLYAFIKSESENEEQAKENAKAFLQDVYSINSMSKLDFADKSLKDMLDLYKDYMDGKHE